mmetsp:Transcript_11427/g.37782  ORF Transcript_11427/g.37782 Transcript_11427/m.37782 type:complete len:553 (+) Transcript_11427:413-2071(+)
MALALACRVLLQLDDSVRALVVRHLRRLDQWSMMKLVLGVLALARTLLSLRQIARTRGLPHWLLDQALPYVKLLPPVRRELESSQAKVRADLEKVLFKDLTVPRKALPASGVPMDELTRLLDERHEIDTRQWAAGTVTGAIYHGEHEHMDFVGRAYGRFAFFNPLHASLHPATRQMDAEVVAMVLRMYSGPRAGCGAFTTGGTESILMAMKAYRDWGRTTKGITNPNIVIPLTAHAAFDKAGQYFGLEVRHARCSFPQQQVEMRHVRSLVDGNTVALVGSAPQYASGTIDPMEELSALALARGIGLHVDCCLGGFLVPFMEKAGLPPPHGFDFRLAGVTSISCDPHKYGFAPKGASVLLFRSRSLRHHMYTFATRWTGGIYATPTMLGSRPGGAVAGTWAAMMRYGEAGYIESTRSIVRATREIAAALSSIDGLELVGRADACVVAFGARKGSGLNCYAVADCLKDVGGWELATLQNPPAVHLAVTLPTSRNAERFVADLRTAVARVRELPAQYTGGSAGLYGMVSSLPTGFIEETVKVYLDTMSACPDDDD